MSTEIKCCSRVKTQKSCCVVNGSMYDPSIRDSELRSVYIAICYNSAVNFGIRKIGRDSRDFSITWHNKQQTKDVANNSAKSKRT